MISIIVIKIITQGTEKGDQKRYLLRIIIYIFYSYTYIYIHLGYRDGGFGYTT